MKLIDRILIIAIVFLTTVLFSTLTIFANKKILTTPSKGDYEQPLIEK